MTNKMRRFGGLFLALVLMMSLTLSLAAPAMAATTNQTISRSDKAFGRWSKCEDITVRTGKGLSYTFGWKKTTMTIKNTGTQAVYLYQVVAGQLVYRGPLYAGCSKSYTLSGSNKTYQFVVQAGSYRNGNYGSFRVTTSAGSVW